MEAPGPEIKRPRHHYDVQQRSISQQHAPPPPPHQGQQGVLPTPSVYPPSSQQPQPPPLSPFHDVTHDSRNLPNPHSYVEQHPHSGHTTPRDGRFQHDLDYSRRGSASGASRSPIADHNPFPQRPISINTGSDGSQYPAQYPTDPGGPMSAYPPENHINGNMHGPPLTMNPHDQPAHPMAPPYGDGYTQSPVTAGPASFGSLPYGHPMAHTGGRPKKGNRATQACDVCRTRKAKCDEGRPRCGFCVENDLQCNYQSVAPAKMDRANQAIMEQLEMQQQDMKIFKDDFTGRFERLEKLLSSQAINHNLGTPTIEETETKAAILQRHSPNHSGLNPQHSATSGAQQSSASKELKTTDISPNSSSFNVGSSDASSSDSLPSVAKQNAIHTEHNTAAQKLFRWPSIKALLQRCKGLHFTESSENYVLDMELHKGPLHLYGKGQGPDPADGSQLNTNAASPASSATSAPSDESSDVSSPASSVDLVWGHGFNPYVGDAMKDSVTGGLCLDNTLKFDSRTITKYHQSYLHNMQILHPILDETALAKTIESFKRRYGSSTEHSSAKAAFAIPLANANLDAVRDPVGGFNKPIKRKHSDGQFWAETGLSQAPPSPKPMLERSPATAIVLLVMALGNICECRDAIPGPVPVTAKEATASRPYLDSSPPFQMRRSPSSSTYPTAPSPANLARQNHSSPRSSVSDPPPHPKNLDLIPGLAYYAQATDILGNMTGSHDITYVQCCILAGLYAGQLANSVESLTWIQSAARGCCILARDPSLRNHPKSRRNSIRLAFYTSLQLESDILAEIDFPPSGIRRIENVAYPDGYYPEDAPSSQASNMFRKSVVMQFYSYQLHLRKLLDWIQQEVYPQGKELTEAIKNKGMRSIFHDWLDNQWRAGLPPEYSWQSGEVAREINHARLRGKYFGALYIIHRPMVHYALELEAKGELDRYFSQDAEQDYGPMAPPRTPLNPFLEDVLRSAKLAIEAAVRSTEAFDGAMMYNRLIVTNIFGTAHAQFGNMLVLSAVYKSKYLSGFIADDPRVKLGHLFRRTINFLGQLKAISPTLGHDQFILQALQVVVFGEKEDTMNEAATSSSFG